MNKIKNSKGFTLMEMLIVVAIIAVLVAIAIPTFTTSLNKARVATDEANIRSGYATVMAKVLTEELATETEQVFTLQKNGDVVKQGDTTGTTTASDYECFGKPDTAVEIAGQSVGPWEKGTQVTYTVKKANDNTDKVIVTIGAPKA